MYHYHQYLLLKPLLYTDHHPYFSKSTNFLTIMPHIQNNFCVNSPTGANVIKKELCRPFDKDLPDFAICVKYLKNWARSRNDGRFDIIVAKKQRGPALEGMFNRVELTCSRAGRYISKSNGKRTGFSKKCNCPWRLSIIQKRIGNEVKWVRGYMHEWPRGFNYEENNSHGGTHVLDRNEVNGSLRRSIPERFDRDIDLLIDAAMSPKDIYNFLTRACKKEGLIVSFVMKDVVNRVYKVRQSKTDLTSLLVECSLKSASDTHSTINLIKDQIKKLTGRADVDDMVVYNNPEINVKQKQKRIMPGDVSAPTSKAYKNSSKKRKTELNEKVKNLKTSIINLN